MYVCIMCIVCGNTRAYATTSFSAQSRDLIFTDSSLLSGGAQCATKIIQYFFQASILCEKNISHAVSFYKCTVLHFIQYFFLIVIKMILLRLESNRIVMNTDALWKVILKFK